MRYAAPTRAPRPHDIKIRCRSCNGAFYRSDCEFQVDENGVRLAYLVCKAFCLREDKPKPDRPGPPAVPAYTQWKSPSEAGDD